MPQFKTLVEKIRSKNAGPFWLTVDIFCRPEFTVDQVSPLVTNERIADLFCVSADEVLRFEQADIDVIKFSFPRPSIQGTRVDRDMHGASFAILLEEMEVDL